MDRKGHQGCDGNDETALCTIPVEGPTGIFKTSTSIHQPGIDQNEVAQTRNPRTNSAV